MDDSIPIRIQSNKKGPKLLLLGTVHGNEVAGTKAIEKIIKSFAEEELALIAGELLCLAPVNKLAYEKGLRFIDQDLNRVLQKKEKPETHEACVANKLASVIDECDVLFDLHTTLAPGPVSVFIDFPTENNKRFACALGAEYSLFDWPKVYDSNEYKFESYDTTRYAFEHGKDGVILECGQHNDPHSVEVARLGIIRALAHYKMITSKEVVQSKPTQVYMKKLESKLSNRDSFVKRWGHLEYLKAGEVIAIRSNGQEIRTKENSRILFPKHGAQAGDEWFYLGTEYSHT